MVTDAIQAEIMPIIVVYCSLPSANAGTSCIRSNSAINGWSSVTNVT